MGLLLLLLLLLQNKGNGRYEGGRKDRGGGGGLMYVYDGCLLIASRKGSRLSVDRVRSRLGWRIAQSGERKRGTWGGGSGRAVEGIAMSLIALKLQ